MAEKFHSHNLLADMYLSLQTGSNHSTLQSEMLNSQTLKELHFNRHQGQDLKHYMASGTLKVFAVNI